MSLSEAAGQSCHACVLLQDVESFEKYLQLPASKPSHLTFVVKKCKELAVASVNSTSSDQAVDSFFKSIRTLLGQHQHLHHSIFYCACASAAVQVAETAQAKGIWCWDQASNLMQDLCWQLESHWPSMCAFSAVNMLQALSKCHLQQDLMPEECLDAASDQVLSTSQYLTQQGVSLTAWSCASLYQRHNPTKYYPLLDRLSQLALDWPRGSTRLQHAATIIWSMARSQYLPSEELLLKLTDAACIQIDQSWQPHAAQDIEMLFLGYAWLGYPPPLEAMQKLVRHLLRQRLLGYQASNMAWSLAVLGALKMPLFRSLLTHVSQEDLENMKVNRQLHFAAEFLRPQASSGALYDEWQLVTERLHRSWSPNADDGPVRGIRTEVLSVLREGLGLKCREDVYLDREHDHSLFVMDILIEEQPGIPCDIAVEVDGPDCFIHNHPDHPRCVQLCLFLWLVLLCLSALY